MFYWIAAYVVVLLHLAFVLFVIIGACLSLRWRWMPWLHLPAVGWGALIQFQGWLCPLTPLESCLRMAAGQAGYPGGFIEHYLLPLIYPAELDRQLQLILGSAYCCSIS